MDPQRDRHMETTHARLIRRRESTEFAQSIIENLQQMHQSPRPQSPRPESPCPQLANILNLRRQEADDFTKKIIEEIPKLLADHNKCSVS